jgi:hypothetical protein
MGRGTFRGIIGTLLATRRACRRSEESQMQPRDVSISMGQMPVGYLAQDFNRRAKRLVFERKEGPYRERNGDTVVGCSRVRPNGPHVSISPLFISQKSIDCAWNLAGSFEFSG